jgi:hypothetical protein
MNNFQFKDCIYSASSFPAPDATLALARKWSQSSVCGPARKGFDRSGSEASGDAVSRVEYVGELIFKILHCGKQAGTAYHRSVLGAGEISSRERSSPAAMRNGRHWHLCLRLDTQEGEGILIVF